MHLQKVLKYLLICGFGLLMIVWISSREEPAPASALADLHVGYGPPDTKRANLKYYEEIFKIVRSYSGVYNNSILDIGSGIPPILRHITWVKNKTILAPYYETYKTIDNSGDVYKGGFLKEWNISAVIANFMDANVHVHAEIVLCSQVIEHVPNPEKFIQKLFQSGKIVIISVPYKWPDPHKRLRTISGFTIRGFVKSIFYPTEHLHHNIDEVTIKGWTGDVHYKTSVVVDEDPNNVRNLWSRRIIQVYEL